MYLAIDIGATKTLIALFSKRGRVVRRVKFPTAQGSKTFITELSSNLKIFLKYRITSIVIAVPGTVQNNCSVRFGNREWGDIDIVTPIKSLFNCPIYLENDANLAALYEAHGLSGRIVFLTFSTGIGGGIVEGNHLVARKRCDTKELTGMYEGLIFYLAMARFGRGLKDKGFDLCFPVIDENVRFDIKGLYNIRLAIDGAKDIVKNDFSFKEDERIFILTGPNRGGKTIIEQAIGIASVMASHGLFVTADSFTGMPFTNILTHFPIDENLTINYGRLGEEAVRIKEMVKEADDNTLLLFNESFSTTSSADALYLAKDLIHILKEKGSYVIFNTHIHELATDIPEMNEWEGRGRIVSIVMEMKDNKSTFKVKRSEPDTSSYARNIAEKYGITYEQMKEL